MTPVGVTARVVQMAIATVPVHGWAMAGLAWSLVVARLVLAVPVVAMTRVGLPASGLPVLVPTGIAPVAGMIMPVRVMSMAISMARELAQLNADGDGAVADVDLPGGPGMGESGGAQAQAGDDGDAGAQVSDHVHAYVLDGGSQLQRRGRSPVDRFLKPACLIPSIPTISRRAARTGSFICIYPSAPVRSR